VASLAVTVVLVFDVAAALGLLAVALADPPEGPAEVGEAFLGALGAGTLALAAAFHGGHVGLPRISTPGAAVSGTLGALAFLVALGRAVGRGRLGAA
jgi:hypothetical protein